MKLCKKLHKINKYHDKSDLIHCLPKNSSKSSSTSTNKESAKTMMWIEATNMVDFLLGNNRSFDCKVALLSRITYYERPKEHMESISRKW